MSLRKVKILCLIWILCLSCFLVPDARATQQKTTEVAVLISRNIKPYIEAFEGFKSTFQENGKKRLSVFILEEFKDKNQLRLRKKLNEGKINLIVCIGPEAARFSWNNSDSLPNALYTMVLHPEKIIKQPLLDCGISMDIPLRVQIQEISKVFPTIRKIGLLYDPEFNELLVNQIGEAASIYDIQIVPLKVTSRKKITSTLKKNWDRIDGLWMIPDRTVISESIVQYIIKKALLKKKAVIGYNRFFYKSGAVMAFVFNYKDLGIQAANMASGILSGIPCRKTDPEFHVWLNLKMIQKLGLSVPEKVLRQIEK